MASLGTSEEQARVVADVCTKVFGEPIRVENVIGETLRRVTEELDFS
jgi:hypothetical protein